MPMDVAAGKVYSALVITTDGRRHECFMWQGHVPKDGWVIASWSPEMDSAVWFSQVNVISISLHEMEE